MKKILSGDEGIFPKENITLKNFWAWAYSDLMSNTVRPLFAEFLVGKALGLLSEPRVEWNYVDFIYCGKKIEVKSSAYVQTWQQKNFSLIKFDIAEKKGWIAETNSFTENICRSADIYVFCLYSEKNFDRVNPLEISHWKFYVVPTETLNLNCVKQKSISLSKIEKFSRKISFAELKTEIDKYCE